MSVGFPGGGTGSGALGARTGTATGVFDRETACGGWGGVSGMNPAGSDPEGSEKSSGRGGMKSSGSTGGGGLLGWYPGISVRMTMTSGLSGCSTWVGLRKPGCVGPDLRDSRFVDGVDCSGGQQGHSTVQLESLLTGAWTLISGTAPGGVLLYDDLLLCATNRFLNAWSIGVNALGDPPRPSSSPSPPCPDPLASAIGCNCGGGGTTGARSSRGRGPRGDVTGRYMCTCIPSNTRTWPRGLIRTCLTDA